MSGLTITGGGVSSGSAPSSVEIGDVQASARVVLEGPINVKDPTYGATGDGTTTDSTAIQAAITAASTTTSGGGAVFLPRGIYNLSAASLTIAPALSGLKVFGEGIGNTILKLGGSGSGRRAFDFARTADGQVFQNIQVSDFTVDCNNVTGYHHVVIGTLTDGVIQQRVNMKDIAVRRVKTVNVPVVSSGALGKRNVDFTCHHPTVDEATQGYVRNITVEDCDFQGGNYGIRACGSGSGANVFVDNIRCIRCRHSLLAVQPNVSNQTNFHIGSWGFGGYCLIEGCYGKYSGDTGTDVDGMTVARILNTDIEDCTGNAFYYPNFRYPGLDDGIASSASHNTLDSQRQLIENCHARANEAFPVGSAFRAENATYPIGAFIIRDSSYYRTMSGATHAGEAIAFNVANGLTQADIYGFRCVTPNVTPAAGYPDALIGTVGGAVTQKDIRNVTFVHPSA